MTTYKIKITTTNGSLIDWFVTANTSEEALNIMEAKRSLGLFDLTDKFEAVA